VILLIGWDAADWDVLDPLLDAGLLPNLSRLVDGGCRGRLASMDPPLSPMLWTSIATGKRPWKHGVHGFVEAAPEGGGVRPIRVTRRTAKAVWNILQQQGQRVHTVGWWPSHPAEPLSGMSVSNLFQQAVGPRDRPWPMPPGAVHPAAFGDFFARLRIHPGD
jgi:predicted AlkP superfamily phosphohydrolase/phosphomutase